MWVGTEDGLALIDKTTGKVVQDLAGEGRPAVQGRHRHRRGPEDRRRVARPVRRRASRGSRGGRFDHWHQLNSGLVNDVVYGVAVENDNVWAATTAGASRFNTVTGEWTIFTEKNAPMEEIWNYGVSYDGKDKVYLAVWGSGVLEYDIATGRWKEYLDPDGEMEIDLYRDDGINHVIVTGREPRRGRPVGLDLLRRLALRRPPLARLRRAGGRPALRLQQQHQGAAARRRRWFCSDKGLGIVMDAPTETRPGSPTRATPRPGAGGPR